MAVIVSKNGHEAHKVERSTFDKEGDLQRYLRDNPEALPIDQIREGSRILVLAREFATASGPIDLLAVDDQGSLYVIETKLYRNPDKRTVVAQVLDYGAALWKHTSDFGQFRITLEEYMQKQWHATLEDQITATFGVDDEGRERILSNLADCLEDGRFRFLVLMDQVHDQLRDLVSYLNANSNFQLYCVELEYYRHDGYEILIPHVYGAEGSEIVPEEVIKTGLAVLQDMGTFWHKASLTIKQQFQRFLFPEGIAFGESGFGTCTTAFCIQRKAVVSMSENTMVAPRRIELLFGD